MLHRKTVFVVGAGASVEVGLPTGAELTRQIASLLDLKWELNRQTRGDHLIAGTLMHLSRAASGHQSWDITSEVRAARRISGAMVEALSIDNYMEAHNNDSNVMLVGKLAIARAIGAAERASVLWFDHFKEAFNPGKIKETWYQKFWQLLHQGITRQSIEQIFDNLTIVSFNYDRCIQQRIFHGLLSYYGLNEHEAIQLLSKLNILYPYGSLGPYENPVSFGVEYDQTTLGVVATRLKTFSERVEDEECLSSIKTSISQAERIVFLGYAFHPQNNSLLASVNTADSKQIYATAYGIPHTNREALLRAIAGIIGFNAPTEIDFSTSCQFFNNYWYHLFDA